MTGQKSSVEKISGCFPGLPAPVSRTAFTGIHFLHPVKGDNVLDNAGADKPDYESAVSNHGASPGSAAQNFTAVRRRRLRSDGGRYYSTVDNIIRSASHRITVVQLF
jgi:hypothetical protein